MKELLLVKESAGSGTATTTLIPYDDVVTSTLIPDDNATWTNVTAGMNTGVGFAEWTSSAPLVWANTASFGVLPANTEGYLEYDLDYASTYTSGGFYIGGFSLSASGTAYNDIEYAFYFESGSSNRLSILIANLRYGATSGNTPSFKLKIHRDSAGIVTFYKNGVLYYTHPTPTTSALYFNNRINRYMGVYNCKIVYDSYGTTPPAWIDRNGDVTTTLGKIVPSSSALGWDKSASFEKLPSANDGYAEFKAVYGIGSTGGDCVVGLATTYSGGNYTSINYGINLVDGSNVEIFELGVSKGTHGAWSLTDVFKVERTGSTITYLKNGVVFYTSLTSNFTDLYFDCSINQYMGAEDISIVYTTTNPISLETKKFDLYDEEIISVTKEGISVNDIGSRASGITNSFYIPATPPNNEILDYLELEGNVSEFPYQENYARYIEDGIELISRGRLKISELTDKGYKVDIIHGINDFFDKIKGKFLYEAYEPYRVTLQQMVSAQTTLCNTTTVRDNEGYCVPLMDLAGVSPIADYQQTCAYYLDFGLNKIAESVGYTVNSIEKDLTDYAFTYEELPMFTGRVNNFIDNKAYSTALSTGTYKLFKHIMRESGSINFQQLNLYTNIMSGTPPASDVNILINGSIIQTFTFTAGVYSTHSYNTSPTVYNKGDVIELELDLTGLAPADSISFQYFLSGVYSSEYNVYHENILQDYTQTDFLKNIMQVFNLGVNVNELTKELDFYSLNTTYSNVDGTIVDLSKYYNKTIKKDFKSDYGVSNYFRYKYENEDSPFANGVLPANNVNNDKVIIDSPLTASLNYTPLTLGNDNVKLTTVDGYNVQATNAKANNIGNRINKVLRFETSGGTPVSVDYINSSLVTSTVTSDQTTLTFAELDWATILDNEYNNLRDNVLNRYAQYTLQMKVPDYIIRSWNFKDKMFIESLGTNFVVEKIVSLENGISEWTVIKLNIV